MANTDKQLELGDNYTHFNAQLVVKKEKLRSSQWGSPKNQEQEDNKGWEGLNGENIQIQYDQAEFIHNPHAKPKDSHSHLKINQTDEQNDVPKDEILDNGIPIIVSQEDNQFVSHHSHLPNHVLSIEYEKNLTPKQPLQQQINKSNNFLNIPVKNRKDYHSGQNIDSRFCVDAIGLEIHSSSRRRGGNIIHCKNIIIPLFTIPEGGLEYSLEERVSLCQRPFLNNKVKHNIVKGGGAYFINYKQANDFFIIIPKKIIFKENISLENLIHQYGLMDLKGFFKIDVYAKNMENKHSFDLSQTLGDQLFEANFEWEFDLHSDTSFFNFPYEYGKDKYGNTINQNISIKEILFENEIYIQIKISNKNSYK